MKNNKRGFTLVELLSIIVLIALIIGISVPGISRISERMKERSFNTKKGLIEQAGTLWGQDNKTRLQNHKCNIDKEDNDEEYPCYKVSIFELIDNDYLESDGKDESGNLIYLNPMDNKSMIDKCVYVYKKNNRIYSYFGNDTNCNT